jgi:hypothetical protein
MQKLIGYTVMSDPVLFLYLSCLVDRSYHGPGLDNSRLNQLDRQAFRWEASTSFTQLANIPPAHT